MAEVQNFGAVPIAGDRLISYLVLVHPADLAIGDTP